MTDVKYISGNPICDATARGDIATLQDDADDFAVGEALADINDGFSDLNDHLQSGFVPIVGTLVSGFYPTDEVWMKGANPNINSSDKYLVSPKTWNNNNNRFAMFGFNRNTQNTLTYILGYGDLGTGHTAYTMPVAPNSDFHRFYYADRISVCPDLAIGIGVANVNFGSETANLKLFYGYNSNTAGKICYYIHEKADGRKIALYACYRKSDGVIGMYDVENDVFYTNDGSGDFTKGADV